MLPFQIPQCRLWRSVCAYFQWTWNQTGKSISERWKIICTDRTASLPTTANMQHPKNLSEIYHEEGRKVIVLFSTIWTIHRRPNDNSDRGPEKIVLHVSQFPLHKAQMTVPVLLCRHRSNYCHLWDYLAIRDVWEGTCRGAGESWRVGPCRVISLFSSFAWLHEDCSSHQNTTAWSKSRGRWWKLSLPILP